MGFPVWYDRPKARTLRPRRQAPKEQEAVAMINVKEKIEQIVEKLKNDEDLLKKFNKNPASVIEEYVGIDLPDDQVNQLVEGIKAKIKLDKIGDALGGLSGLFGKK